MDVLCYILSAVDNDSFALGNETRNARSHKEREYFDWRFTHNGGKHPATCEQCGRKTDPRWIAKDFKVKKKRNYDLTYTYDGYYIASENFAHALQECGCNSFELLELPNDEGLFALFATEVITVDKERSKGIRFLYPCNMCGSFAGVFGTSDLCFESAESISPSGISRTDLEFAQAHEQHPLLILGTETADKLKQYKLRGISLRSVAK